MPTNSQNIGDAVFARALRATDGVAEPAPPKKLTAVVTIGGAGGQMKPLTEGQPKALVPIGDRPLLAHIIASLPEDIFDPVIVVYRTYESMVQHYVGQIGRDLGRSIELLKVDGPPALALKNLASADRLSNPFLVYYGDIVLGHQDIWPGVLQQFQTAQSAKAPADRPVGIALASTSHYHSIGVWKVDTHDPTIARDIEEKPFELGDRTLANFGVALFGHQFLEFIERGDEDLFGDVVPQIIASKKFRRPFLLPSPRPLWVHIQSLSDWIDVQTVWHHWESQHRPSRRLEYLRTTLKSMRLV